MALEYPDSALNQYSMANQPPYMLVGQPQNPQYGQQQSSYRNLPFNLSDHQQVASTSTAHLGTAPGASSSLPQTSFRAPAHKHAHHLHSIPPREKSTRTLIIDHMLWVHGRTRFAQARAELGLTDRTGGPSSPNYIHRTRPESYEEEDEDGSEGEDVVTLKGRAGGHGENDAEEERIRKQDLSLARSLRLRAEGLEKVVTSMLEQPPPIHPINDEEILTPPTSPKLNPSSHSHPHRLPNGVRLRLALGTIINDLFARQAPPPPYRHTQIPNSKATTPSDVSPSVIPSPSDLPDALTALAPVSGAFARPLSPSRITQSSRSVQSSPPFQSSSYSPQGSSHMHNQYQPRRSQPPPSPSNVNTRPQPSARVKSLYAVGADPSTANSPPAFRCPRHLHTGCEICVEAKSPTRNAGAGSRGRSASTTGSSSNSWKAMPGGVGPGGGGITGWQEGTGVGSGLLRPSVQGSALRRKIIESGDDATAGAGNAKLSKLIPRFIRLSALVAAELGRESRGEEDASEDGRGREGSVAAASAATPTGNVSTPGRSGSVGWNASGTSGGFSPLPPSPTIPMATPQTQVNQARNRTHDQALRPSLEWYMLLSGLLTRAVLEGYLTAGWTGLQAVQCLLLVGLGMNENAKKRRNEDGDDDESDEEDGEEFADLYPDELPSLSDAVKILFPSLRDASSGIKDQAEEVYGVEMLERLKRFYDIPDSTPDCSTRMEDLAWQYPAEPVERAAVRFCEAIAKWRGKPELETYKKKPPQPADLPTSPGGSAPMTIESLVHSNPSSPIAGNAGFQGQGSSRRRKLKKPSIDVYFTQSHSQSPQVTPTRPQRPNQHMSPPQVSPMQHARHIQQLQHQQYQYQHRRGASGSGSGSWNLNNNNKRSRDADDAGRPDAPKRMYP